MIGRDSAPTTSDVERLAAGCRGHATPLVTYPHISLAAARFHSGADADLFAARLAASPPGDCLWRYEGRDGLTVLVAVWQEGTGP